MTVSLILLSPGSIRDIFAPWRAASVRKSAVRVDPLGLPSVRTQCVHVDIMESSGALLYERCMNDSETSGFHGFYCRGHQEIQRTYKLPSDELAQARFIVEQDRRALEGVQLEVVKIGKTTIRFVSGVQMKADPDKYNRVEFEGGLDEA